MKAWGGRFEKPTDEFVEQFTASLPFDWRLFRVDISGSIAHAHMLAAKGVIESEEAEDIESGLGRIREQIESGKFEFDVADEDIHMAIERALTDDIGAAGAKLHTARSRNDQVALDLRMYMKEEIVTCAGLIVALQETLLSLAADNRDAVMPGYTHLQRAQPVLVAHHMLAYVQMLSRDFVRLVQCFASADVMPLGSAALAGTGFPIDRQMVAGELGFERVSENSMDSVSDRDFVLDFLGAASTIMVHLSRLCEEIVLWSSSEFGFVALDDAYTTGSSIMPQKKNPDVAELVRGKAGRVFGDLAAVQTMLKGLPLAYNRDLQEDKESVFDALDTVKDCLVAVAGMAGTMTFNSEATEAAAGGFTAATDLADYLVEKGVAFRDAHEVVGKIVLECEKKGKALDEMSPAELAKFHEAFATGAPGLGARDVVARHASQGGTAPERVADQFEAAAEQVAGAREWIDERG